MSKAGAVVLLGALLFGCGIYRERIHVLPIEGSERTLALYRVPTGPIDRRLDIRLEWQGRSVPVESLEGSDWVEIRCGAVTIAGSDRKRISYMVAPNSAPLLIGAYDLVLEESVQALEADREALRKEMYRVYHKHPDFPKDPAADLFDWALYQHCRQAFQDLYGSAAK